MSGRGLCDEPITLPSGVSERDRESSEWRPRTNRTVEPLYNTIKFSFALRINNAHANITLC
jgi:hypothetical protein